MGHFSEYRGLYVVPDSSTSIHLVSPNNPERGRLAEYETAIRIYAEAVSRLSNHQEGDGEFKDTLTLVDFARRTCEQARLARDNKKAAARTSSLPI